MSAFDPRSTLRAPSVLLGLVAVGLLGPGQARALTPTSPEVQQAIAKAQQFLVKAKVEGQGPKLIGSDVLVGLALYKSTQGLKDSPIKKDHPRIKAAISTAREGIRSGEVATRYESGYAVGLCVILLAATKDPQYQGDIRAGLKLLQDMQRPHGGFSAKQGHQNGDTSMTQYCVLGLWDAAHAGVPVPAKNWQGVTDWLLKIQLASGSFPYNPPARSGSPSMGAAGGGSLYICANYIRKSNPAAFGERRKRKKGLPSALERVPEAKKKEAGRKGMEAVSVNADRLREGMARVDDWMDANFEVSPEEWPLYYLYAVERYYAFREDWEKKYPKEPSWYTEGAQHLIKVQAPEGSFRGWGETPISTAFATLFLVRSTRISLGTVETASGSLLSGTGLPTDLSNIRVKAGEVVVKPLAGPAGELLDIMADPDDPRLQQAVEGFGELEIKADDVMVSKHLLAIQKLAKGGVPAARAKAVEALGKTRNLDHVPTFIYALADDHPVVMRAARDALRFVSRKFDGFGFSPDLKPLEKNKIIEQWKNWYRTVRPDAEFED